MPEAAWTPAPTTRIRPDPGQGCSCPSLLFEDRDSAGLFQRQQLLGFKAALRVLGVGWGSLRAWRWRWGLVLAAEWGLSPGPQSGRGGLLSLAVPLTAVSLRSKPTASQIPVSKGLRVPGWGADLPRPFQALPSS